MKDKRLFTKNIFLLLLAFTAIFSSCGDMFENTPGDYLETYGYVASVDGVSYSREYSTSQDGWITIDASSTFTINYHIDNPGNFNLNGVFSFDPSSPVYASSGSLNSDYCKTGQNANETFSLTFTPDLLKLVDGLPSTDRSLCPKLTLYNKKSGVVQSGYSLNIRSNSPPPPIALAQSLMLNDPAAGMQGRLMIMLSLPQMPSDVNLLTVVPGIDQTEHSFKIEGGQMFYGTETNGWTLHTDAPSGIDASFPDAKTYYIVTTIDNISERELFYITLRLTDTGGLTSEISIPSKLLVLEPPTGSLMGTDTLLQLEQDDFGTFTIYAPENAKAATVNFAITDSSGNPVACTSGSTSAVTGDAVFHLLPKEDGSEETYTISSAYLSLAGYKDSEDSAAQMGVNGTIKISGTRLSAPTTSADGISSAQNSESFDGYTLSIYNPNTIGTLVYELDGNEYSDDVSEKAITLYPNTDGSALNHTISRLYVKRPYHVQSDDSASAFGSGGTIEISGIKLSAPTENKTDFDISGAEYILTSPEGASINYTIEKGVVPFASEVGAPSPVTVTLGGNGTYSVTAQATKTYYEDSDMLSSVLNVTTARLYVSSQGGDDAAHDGSIQKPFASLRYACDYFSDKTAVDASGRPKNTVCFMTDMTFTVGMGLGTSVAVQLVGCKGATAENPLTGVPVNFYCDTPGDSTLYLANNQNFVIRGINWTQHSGTTNNYAAIVIPSSSSASSLTIENCSFTGITGQGVSVIALEGGSLTLKNVTISENNTKRNGSGYSKAAVFIKGGTFRIDGKVVISNNTIEPALAGVYGKNLISGDANSSAPIVPIGFVSTDADAITGTSIGISTDPAPVPGNSIDFTSGYSYINFGKPSLFFTSDSASYGVGYNATSHEACVATGGGGIVIDLPEMIEFTASPNPIPAGGGTVTITAKKSGGAVIPSAEISGWNVSLFYGSVDLGRSWSSPSFEWPTAYGSGTYIIKVQAVYKGTTYSGEVQVTR